MTKKRFVVGLICSFLFTVLAAAQSITLLTPNGGQSLEIGSHVAILWKYTGIVDTAKVRLVLFQNGAKLGEIASNVPITAPPAQKGFGGLDGQWLAGTLPGGASVKPGCGFTIRVLVAGSNASDTSDAGFCLTGPLQKSLQLTSPKGGETWPLSSVQKIAWICSGYSGKLLFKLRKGGADWGLIGQNLAGGQFINWKVGESPKGHEFVTGSDYTISLEPMTRSIDLPAGFGAVSKPFTITVPEYQLIGQRTIGLLAESWVKWTSPAPGPGVVGSATRMMQFTVSWECSESMKKEYATMSLLRSGQAPRVLLKKFPLSIGKHLLQLDSEMPLGEYRLRIQALKWPEVQADSGAFNLLANVKTVKFSFDAQTRNVYKYRHTTAKGAFSSGCEGKEWADPGPMAARVGYHNITLEKNTFEANDVCRFIYRSHVQFDLQYEHGEILSANLTYTEFNAPPAVMNFYALTAAWDGQYLSLFSIPCVKININDANQMRGIVQNWVNHPEQNFGIVITGNDERLTAKPPSAAIHILNQIRLQVTEKVTE